MTNGCVHLLYIYNSSWKFLQLATGQFLSGQSVRYGKGCRYGPSIIYKVIPAGSLSSSQPGGPPSWGQPSSLRPHWASLSLPCRSVLCRLYTVLVLKKSKPSHSFMIKFWCLLKRRPISVFKCVNPFPLMPEKQNYAYPPTPLNSSTTPLHHPHPKVGNGHTIPRQYTLPCPPSQTHLSYISLQARILHVPSTLS